MTIHPIKLHKDDLEEAWNSSKAKKIREQMLNGERPEMCTRCFPEEDAGLKVLGIPNDKWKDPRLQDRKLLILDMLI